MKSLTGILIGLAAGTAIGLLLAPQSGKKTRRRINSDSESFFKNLQDQLQDGLDNIRSQYDDLVDNASSRSQEAIKEAKKRTKF